MCLDYFLTFSTFALTLENFKIQSPSLMDGCHCQTRVKSASELLFFHKNNKFHEIPREINSSITRKRKITERMQRQSMHKNLLVFVCSSFPFFRGWLKGDKSLTTEQCSLRSPSNIIHRYLCWLFSCSSNNIAVVMPCLCAIFCSVALSKIQSQLRVHFNTFSRSHSDAESRSSVPIDVFVV